MTEKAKGRKAKTEMLKAKGRKAEGRKAKGRKTRGRKAKGRKTRGRKAKGRKTRSRKTKNDKPETTKNRNSLPGRGTASRDPTRKTESQKIKATNNSKTAQRAAPLQRKNKDGGIKPPLQKRSDFGEFAAFEGRLDCRVH
jgi:hypothetical protein